MSFIKKLTQIRNNQKLKKMKKVILIFGVLSLLVFIRPVLNLNASTTNTTTTTVATTTLNQAEDVQEKTFVAEAIDGIKQFYSFTGFANAQSGNIIMIIIGIVFIYLGIKFDYEPLLLIPIGVGVMLGNIPFVTGYQTGIYESGSVLNYLYFGVVKGVYPPLIFLGIGAMTDFSSLIANPKLMLLGAAAQIGVFGTFLGALYLGFNLPEAGAIGIIGGADGPTAIFLSSKLANGINILPDGTTVKNLIGPIAIAAYSYMALVPVIQPPIMKLLTTKKERLIRMKPPRAVSQKEKMIFPVVALLLTTFISPSALPLLGMLFFGNLLKESGRTERLADTARTKLIDIVTIILGFNSDYFQNSELLLMAVNVFLVAIVLRIVKWELTCELMPKKAKTLYVPVVLAVVFVLLFAQEAC